MRPRPHAGVVGGRRRAGVELGDLPLERRGDLLRCDRARPRRPIAGNVSSRVRRSSDSTRPPPSRAPFADSCICLIALSIRKAGGTRPLPPRRADPPELAVELRRDRLRGARDRPRRRRLLRPDGRCRGSAACRDRRRRSGSRRRACCASRRRRRRHRAGRSLRARCVGAADDLDAGADRVRQAGRVDRARPAARSARERRREPLLAGRLRSASWSAAPRAAPLSMPSDVAPSGDRRSRFSAIESSSARRLRIGRRAGVCAKRRRAARDAAAERRRPPRAATASRREKLSSVTDYAPWLRGRKRALGSTIRQLPSTPVIRTRSPGAAGPPRALHSPSPTRTRPPCSSTGSTTVTTLPTSRAGAVVEQRVAARCRGGCA